ncbi:MAG: AAA family ATPase [Rhodospirillales bacterium]|nr:AAA family ATPase [Rhodospirillales bacterium]
MPAAPPRSPRIAITGSAGVGKTTLATALAARLALPLVREGMRERLEGGLDLHALGRDGVGALIEALFVEHLGDVDRAVTTAGGFVSDRCPLDSAAFWLCYGFGMDGDATSRIFERAAAAVGGHDLIVMLPWGVLPLVADGVRSANPWCSFISSWCWKACCGAGARGPGWWRCRTG